MKLTRFFGSRWPYRIKHSLTPMGTHTHHTHIRRNSHRTWMNIVNMHALSEFLCTEFGECVWAVSADKEYQRHGGYVRNRQRPHCAACTPWTMSKHTHTNTHVRVCPPIIAGTFARSLSRRAKEQPEHILCVSAVATNLSWCSSHLNN